MHDALTAQTVELLQQLIRKRRSNIKALYPRSPTACAPSSCPPGPTAARRIPAGAAGTASDNLVISHVRADSSAGRARPLQTWPANEAPR